MSKGAQRRPSEVSQLEKYRKWEQTFGTKDDEVTPKKTKKKRNDATS